MIRNVHTSSDQVQQIDCKDEGKCKAVSRAVIPDSPEMQDPVFPLQSLLHCSTSPRASVIKIDFSILIVQFQKISVLPPQKALEFPEGWGVL